MLFIVGNAMMASAAAAMPWLTGRRVVFAILEACSLCKGVRNPNKSLFVDVAKHKKQDFCTFSGGKKTMHPEKDMGVAL